ncbi:CGCGG family putative rSAM-modified RiPP protein [Halocatena marina]|uniref:CGCGG family putative rSAM-modified RiPP protein n=1 Tax=Halocatena marina TaxID=2934937 RepID=UPI00200D9237|nr:CGCGG family rSAM-modified RiPP protein [Halocatena marina]
MRLTGTAAKKTSANLEKPQYEDNLSLLKRHAIEAVEHTASGHHVNLVTHEAHGHPEGFLYDTLDVRFGDEDVHWGYIEQCGCGGHVVRVHVE